MTTTQAITDLFAWLLLNTLINGESISLKTFVHLPCLHVKDMSIIPKVKKYAYMPLGRF